MEILAVDLLVSEVERLWSFAVGGMQGGQVCDGVWRTGGVWIRFTPLFSGSRWWCGLGMGLSKYGS